MLKIFITPSPSLYQLVLLGPSLYPHSIQIVSLLVVLLQETAKINKYMRLVLIEIQFVQVICFLSSSKPVNGPSIPLFVQYKVKALIQFLPCTLLFCYSMVNVLFDMLNVFYLLQFIYFLCDCYRFASH